MDFTPFIPDSILKDIRRKFLIDFSEYIESEIQNKINSITLPRKTLIKKDYKNYYSFPFITDFNDLEINDKIIPLPPVIFDSANYLNGLKEYIKKNPDSILGLNNISHIGFTLELPSDTKYFIDYGIYNTNNFTEDFLIKTIKNISWGTKWVETQEGEHPPIFISRSCFKKNHDGCPKNCIKNYEYELIQNSQKFKVVVKDCLTYTFLA
jgi:hypothetical protein